jgi:hypothetical protein
MSYEFPPGADIKWYTQVYKRAGVSGFIDHRLHGAGELTTRYGIPMSIYPREDLIEWHIAAFMHCFVYATSVMIIGQEAFLGAQKRGDQRLTTPDRVVRESMWDCSHMVNIRITTSLLYNKYCYDKQASNIWLVVACSIQRDGSAEVLMLVVRACTNR